MNKKIMKSMKKIISSAARGRMLDESKLGKALMQYRNTPCKRDGLSPAQKLFGRSVQDTLPVHRRALKMKHQNDFVRAEQKAKAYDDKMAEYYNAHTKELPELKVGQRVAIYNDATKKWDRYGFIVEQSKKRRYIVRTSSGRVLTRNRKYLRARLPVSVLPRSRDSGSARQYRPHERDAVPVQDTEAATGSLIPRDTVRRSSRERKKPTRLIEEDQ